MKTAYLETVRLIERLHRQFLEVVKTELDRLGIKDINNVQSLILANIGTDVLTVGELTDRGYYLGSNVSYNVKKMVENGYLAQERSPFDRRAVQLRVSEKGLALCKHVAALYDRHAASLAAGPVSRTTLETTNATLRTLERFFAGHLAYGDRFDSSSLISNVA
jgi:DNA-binding MarR family transcriptional regulator